MKNYIKENNRYPLFFLHLLLPVFEIFVKFTASGFNSNSVLPSTFAVAHIALLSQIYKRSISSESLNYLLSLGSSRVKLFKGILDIYAREIIFYSFFLFLFLLISKGENLGMYIMVRLIFAFISVPVFLNNMLDDKPLGFIALSYYYLVGRINIYLVVLLAVPTSIYLLKKFKKKMMDGNLI